MKKPRKSLVGGAAIVFMIILGVLYIRPIYRYTTFEYTRQYDFSHGVIDEATLKSYRRKHS